MGIDQRSLRISVFRAKVAEMVTASLVITRNPSIFIEKKLLFLTVKVQIKGFFGMNVVRGKV